MLWLNIFCNFFLLHLPQELPFQVNICIASSSWGLVILKKEKGKTSPNGGAWCQLQIIQINMFYNNFFIYNHLFHCLIHSFNKYLLSVCQTTVLVA